MKLHYGFLFFDYLFKFILQLTKNNYMKIVRIENVIYRKDIVKNFPIFYIVRSAKKRMDKDAHAFSYDNIN